MKTIIGVDVLVAGRYKSYGIFRLYPDKILVCVSLTMLHLELQVKSLPDNAIEIIGIKTDISPYKVACSDWQISYQTNNHLQNGIINFQDTSGAIRKVERSIGLGAVKVYCPSNNV